MGPVGLVGAVPLVGAELLLVALVSAEDGEPAASVPAEPVGLAASLPLPLLLRRCFLCVELLSVDDAPVLDDGAVALGAEGSVGEVVLCADAGTAAKPITARETRAILRIVLLLIWPVIQNEFHAPGEAAIGRLE